MFQALRLAEFLIVHGIPGVIVIKLSLLLVLSFLPMALPVAFLISVLTGFGRLSADSELVAMKANGISLERMAFPVFGFSVVVIIISLLLNLEWVPWGERTFKSLLIKVSNTKVASAVKEGTFTSGFFDLLVYADKVDQNTNTLNRVFIYDERNPSRPVTVVARRGQILPVKTESELGAAVMFKLFAGNIHSNDLETEQYQKIDFGTYRLYLNILEGRDTAALKPKMMAYSSLTNELDARGLQMERKRELETEFWRRYTVALSPLVFVFLGMGFGTIRTRSVRSGAVLIAFLIVMLYWGMQAIGISFATKGHIPPWIAMWAPNIILAFVGAVSFKKSAW